MIIGGQDEMEGLNLIIQKKKKNTRHKNNYNNNRATVIQIKDKGKF